MAWDEATAVAVMGLAPEVRIDGEMPEGVKGWRRFGAATENVLGLFGRGAALVVGAKAKWLDHVDAMELDKYILPAARLAADDFSTVDFGWLGYYLPGKVKRKAAFLAHNDFGDFTAGSTPEQIDLIARAAFENNAPISIQLSLKKLREYPLSDAILAVFKKYEDLKFKDIDLTKETLTD